MHNVYTCLTDVIIIQEMGDRRWKHLCTLHFDRRVLSRCAGLLYGINVYVYYKAVLSKAVLLITSNMNSSGEDKELSNMQRCGMSVMLQCVRSRVDPRKQCESCGNARFREQE
jgi:hypothetical protein